MLTAEQFEIDVAYPCVGEFLEVNNERFCGSNFPNGIIVQTGSTMQWRSDDWVILFQAGWRVCATLLVPPVPPSPPGPPSPPPVPPRAPPRATFFTMRSGSCIVDSNCLQHSSYPSPYATLEACTATVGSILGSSMLLLVDRFEVESHPSCNFDYLLVNGNRYCGHSGPQNVVADAGSTIEWHSDAYTSTAAGWRICGSTLPPREPPTPPRPPTPPTAPPRAVAEWRCAYKCLQP